MEALSLDNILWANTVVASGSVVGLTVYTGIVSRQRKRCASFPYRTGGRRRFCFLLSFAGNARSDEWKPCGFESRAF